MGGDDVGPFELLLALAGELGGHAQEGEPHAEGFAFDHAGFELAGFAVGGGQAVGGAEGVEVLLGGLIGEIQGRRGGGASSGGGASPGRRAPLLPGRLWWRR